MALIKRRNDMKTNKNTLLSSSTFLFLLIMFIGCDEKTTDQQNNDPVIMSIVAFPTSVQLSDSFAVVCSAYEPDGDSLFYDWSCTSGAKISGASPYESFSLFNTKENIRVFYAPDSLYGQNDSIRVECHVRDGKGGGKSAWIFVAITR